MYYHSFENSWNFISRSNFDYIFYWFVHNIIKLESLMHRNIPTDSSMNRWSKFHEKTPEFHIYLGLYSYDTKHHRSTKMRQPQLQPQISVQFEISRKLSGLPFFESSQEGHKFNRHNYLIIVVWCLLSKKCSGNAEQSKHNVKTHAKYVINWILLRCTACSHFRYRFIHSNEFKLGRRWIVQYFFQFSECFIFCKIYFHLLIKKNYDEMKWIIEKIHLHMNFKTEILNEKSS